MGPKRDSEDDISDISQAAKIPKIEHGIAPSPLAPQQPLGTDFSSSVKKKLSNSSRTGQACDRCKVSASQGPIIFAPAQSRHSSA
jgi:hypothetical protein